MVYYLYTYTILMDNFSINGERQQHFVGVQPTTMDLDMFDVSILNKHYFYGDIFSLETRPEEEVNITRLTGKLIDSDGNVVKDNVSFSKKDNDWVNESIHRFSKLDVSGQWQILLTGLTNTGSEIKWGFRFLMPGKPVTEHPRLYFSESELKNRITNESSPIARRILNNALADTGFLKVDIDAIQEGVDMTVNNL